jgi:hypothetical protein
VLNDPDLQWSLNQLSQHDGHILLSTTAPLPQTRERYTPTRLHASGGIGRVWLARDLGCIMKGRVPGFVLRVHLSSKPSAPIDTSASAGRSNKATGVIPGTRRGLPHYLEASVVFGLAALVSLFGCG